LWHGLPANEETASKSHRAEETLQWLVQSGFHGRISMPPPEIEEFAKLLMTEVRDRAVASCDDLLKPHANSPIAKRWRSALDSCSSRDLALLMIPDCVDETLFYLLEAIDSGAMRLSFVARDGKMVDLAKEGMAELAGWFAGGVWKSQYSEQRYIDDFEDLRSPALD
jgi:hypothetical protein